jgi:hypothetical protein
MVVVTYCVDGVLVLLPVTGVTLSETVCLVSVSPTSGARLSADPGVLKAC